MAVSMDDSDHATPSAAERAKGAFASAPAHLQLGSRLLERINAGEWGPGVALPSEAALAERFDVDVAVVNRAISRLVGRGILTRSPGDRGVFVRDSQTIAGERGVTSFSREMAELGKVAGSHLLSTDEAAADDTTAKAMEVPEGTALVHMRRLRTGDGLPVGLQCVSLPAARFPGLAEQIVDDTSLYQLLSERYGIKPLEAVEEFTIARVRGDDASVLELADGSPVFRVIRSTRDAYGIFEYSDSFMRPDRYRLRLVLRNP